jgi:dUTP pyrophosphatase
VKVRFKKLNPQATIPSYAKPGDAGMDITCTDRYFDQTTNCWVYHTGLAVEIPEGYVGLIFPRSSICKVDLSLSNAVGVIDSGYRGEIKFFFRGHPREREGMLTKLYPIGDRIGQMIIMPFPMIDIEEATELSDSVRGTGGFGSSGN